MSTSMRPSPRTSTGTLLVTFILGLLIGISVGHIFWPPSPLVQEESLVADTPEPAAPVEAPPPPVQAAEAPAYEESLWPGRHLIIPISGPALPEAEIAFLREVLPGGILLPASVLQTPAQARQLVSDIRAAMGLGIGVNNLPMVVADPAQIPGLPPLVQEGQWPSLEQLAVLADTYAAACQERGAGVMLTPNLEQHPERPAAEAGAAQAATADGDRAIALALAFADALLERGVITVATSYPGSLHAVTQTGAPLPVLDMPLNTLAEALYPFSEAIAQEIPGMLVGHVAVPALDRAQPQRPASLSPVLVEAVLREKWGYQGVIIADDVSILPGTGVETAVVQALRAGCDAVIINSNDPVTIRTVAAAVQTAVDANALSADRLHQSRARLDAVQARMAKPHGLKGPLPDYVPPAPMAVEPPAPVAVESVPAEPAPPASEVVEPPQPSAPEPAPETPAVQPTPEPSGPAPQPPGTRKETYVVQPGDGLMRIADRYGLSAGDLVRWNALRNADDIKAGQRLVLYLPEETEAVPPPAQPPAAPVVEVPVEPAPVPEPPMAEPGAVPEEPPVEEPKAPAEESASEAPTAAMPIPEAAAPEPEAAAASEVRHRVAPGDTVRGIARRYGVSWRDIVEWNDLRDANDIKNGQRIVVKKAAGE